MANAIDELYKQASGRYDLGSLDEFKESLKDETNRKNLHDALKGTYDLGDFDSFNSVITENLIPDATKANEQNAQVDNAPLGVKDAGDAAPSSNGTQVSLNERVAIPNTNDTIQHNDAIPSVDIDKPAPIAVQSFEGWNTEDLEARFNDEEQRGNEVKQKVYQAKLDELGARYKGNPKYAELALGQIRSTYDNKDVVSYLGEDVAMEHYAIGKELWRRKHDAQYMKNMADINSSWNNVWNASRELGVTSDNVGSRSVSAYWENMKQMLKGKMSPIGTFMNGEYNAIANLSGASYLLEKADQMAKAPSKYGDEGGLENWWQGLSDQMDIEGVFAASTFFQDKRISELAKQLNDYRQTHLVKNENGEEVLQDIDKIDLSEFLTKDEMALMDAYLTYQGVIADRSNDLSKGYTIGQGTAQSIPRMLDMLATHGLTQGAARLFMRAVANTPRLAKSANALEKAYKAFAGPKTQYLLKESVELPLTTAMMPSSHKMVEGEYTQRYLEGLHSNGNPILAGEEVDFKDKARAWGNAVQENFTERPGGMMIDKGFGWILGKFAPKAKVNPWMDNKFAKTISNDYIQSPIGETGEEYIGALMSYVRSYNPMYSDKSNKELRDEAEYMFTPEGFGQTFLTILPMSLVGGTFNVTMSCISGVQYERSRAKLHDYLVESGATGEQADNIIMQIEGSQNEEEFLDKMNTTERNLRTHLNLSEGTDAYNHMTSILRGYYESAVTANESYKTLARDYNLLSDEQKEEVNRQFNAGLEAIAEDSKKRTSEYQQKMRDEQTQSIRQEVDAELANAVREDGTVVAVQFTDANGETKNGYVKTGDVQVVEKREGGLEFSREEGDAIVGVYIPGEEGIVSMYKADATPLDVPKSLAEVTETAVNERWAHQMAAAKFHKGDEVVIGGVSGIVVGSDEKNLFVQQQMQDGTSAVVNIPIDTNLESAEVKGNIFGEAEQEDNVGEKVVFEDVEGNKHTMTYLGNKVYQEDATGDKFDEYTLTNVGGMRRASVQAFRAREIDAEYILMSEAKAFRRKHGKNAQKALDNTLAYLSEKAQKAQAELASAQEELDNMPDAVDEQTTAMRAKAEERVAKATEDMQGATMQMTKMMGMQKYIGTPSKLASKQEIADNIRQMASALGVKVNIADGIGQVHDATAKDVIMRGDVTARAWKGAGGEIELYLPNIHSLTEARELIYHEIIAHKGLKEAAEAFRKGGFDELCDKVWKGMSEADQMRFTNYIMSTWDAEGLAQAKADKKLAEYLKEKAKDTNVQRAAADEYIASIAEEYSRLDKSDLSEKANGIRAKFEEIVEAIRKFFADMLGEEVITKDDIFKMLEQSKKRMQANAEVETDKAERTDSEVSQMMDSKTGVSFNHEGEVVAEKSKEGRTMFNVLTWEKGGRDALSRYLGKQVSEGNLGQEEADNLLQSMGVLCQQAKDIADGNPSGLLSQWNIEEVRMKDGTMVPVMHALKTNSEYDLNIDFSTVCKKRQVINKLMNRIISEGYLQHDNLSSSDVARINQIIQKHGLEVACEICFVDSRRYNAFTFAKGFVDKFNPIVRSLMPKKEVAGFNFSNDQKFSNDGKVDLTQFDEKVDWNTMFNKNGRAVGLKEYSLNWGGIVDMFMTPRKDSKGNPKPSVYEEAVTEYKNSEGKLTFDECIQGALSSATDKMVYLISQRPELRMLAKEEDFVASEGWENVIASNEMLEKLWNIQKGAAGARANESNVQYQSDVLDKSVDEDIFDIAGYRMQSFSDFIGHMYFDYLQAFADLSARQLPGHAYTKEPSFVKLFGLMGMKINMSLVAMVDKSTMEQFGENGRYYAGLMINSEGKLDYCWNTTVRNGDEIVRQGQTFPPVDAYALQDDDIYTKNVGTIAVGLSKYHIEMMLGDNRIRMVIPYHKSGLPHGVALIYNMEEINDYTSTQNTRSKLPKYDGTSGKAKMKKDVDRYNLFLHQLSVAENKQAMYNALVDVFVNGNASEHEDVHAEINRLYEQYNGVEDALGKSEWNRHGSDTFLPKVAADIYKSACESHECTPKFDEFKDNDNYFKVLIDFAVYDKNGMYTPQEVISFNVPENVTEYIMETLQEDEEINANAERLMRPIIDEVEQYLANTELRRKQDAISEKKKIGKADAKFLGRSIFNVGDPRNVPTDHTMMSIVTPEMDAEYMDAVKSGDMKKAEEMVREAVKRAMPNTKVVDENGEPRVVFHGTKMQFNVFDGYKKYNDGLIFFAFDRNFADKWATKDDDSRRPDDLNTRIDDAVKSHRAWEREKAKEYASKYGDDWYDHYNEYREESDSWQRENLGLEGMTIREARMNLGKVVIGAYVNSEKVYNPIKEYDSIGRDLLMKLGLMSEDPDETGRYNYAKNGSYLYYENPRFLDEIKKLGYDSILLSEDGDGKLGTIAAFYPNQIKSADPVTYDNDGNIIPLSERFNAENDDIRFSIEDGKGKPASFWEGWSAIKEVDDAYYDKIVKADQKWWDTTVKDWFDKADIPSMKSNKGALIDWIKNNKAARTRHLNKWYEYKQEGYDTHAFFEIRKAAWAEGNIDIYTKALNEINKWLDEHGESVSEESNEKRNLMKEWGVKKGEKYSVEDARKWFDSINKSKENEELFDLIMPILINLQSRGILNVSFETPNSKTAVGVANSFEGYVKFRPHYFSNNTNSDFASTVILHEFIHSATVYAIEPVLCHDGVSARNYTEEGKRRMELTYAEMPEALQNSARALYKLYSEAKGGVDDKAYGMTNSKEFIAELANPSFTKLLKEKGLFQRFVDELSKLLTRLRAWMTGEEATANMYEATRSVLEQFVENYDEDTALRMFNMRKGQQFYTNFYQNATMADVASSKSPIKSDLASSEENGTRFSLREEPMLETKKAFAAFVVEIGKDGKAILQPKMIKGAHLGTPVLTNLNADTADIILDENGMPVLNTKGRVQIAAGGGLAFRPGKHMAKYPNASQFELKRKPGKMDSRVVYFEVEYSADPELHKQYQRAAWEYGFTEKGGYQHTQAGLPYLPKNSYYIYRTNANPEVPAMIIAGSYRVTRALTDDEAKRLNQDAKGKWLDRENGLVVDDAWLKQVGLDEEGMKESAKNFDLNQLEPAQDNSDFVLENAPGYVRHAIDFKNKALLKAIAENGQSVGDYEDGYGFDPDNGPKGGTRFYLTDTEIAEAERIAREEFGETTDWRETGWLMKDGTQLDLSEKNNGGPKGVRTRDHRDVYVALPARVGTDWRTIRAFESIGNIRTSWMGGQYASIEMSSIPTEEQLKKIRSLVSTAPETTIEFMDSEYHTVAYGDYTSSQGRKAVAEIERFYKEGIKPTTRFSITNAINEEFSVLEKDANRDIDKALDNIEEIGKHYGNEDVVRVAQEMRDIWAESDMGDVFDERDSFVEELQSRLRGAIGYNNTRFSIANANQEVFVSNAAQAVEHTKQDKATPAQWKAMLTKEGGIKAGEDKWMGLSEWLDNSTKKTLTKDEVMNFIRENAIQIEEVKYSEDGAQEVFLKYRDEYKEYYDEAEENGEEDPQDYAWQKMIDDYGDDFEQGFHAYGDELQTNEDSDYLNYLADQEGGEREINGTRLQYTTDGLRNNREIALIVPTIESWNEDDNIHFGDAGEGTAIGWIRFGETEIQGSAEKEAAELNAYTKMLREKYGVKITNDIAPVATREELDKWDELITAMDNARQKSTQRILVIDEIQSKRHQEGREKGYKQDELKVQNAFLNYADELTAKYGTKNVYDALDLATEEENARYQELIDARNKNRKAIPDAPFDKNWMELCFKRMLRLAAEEGYDRVAWTSGSQQARRYGLGGVVDKIRVDGITYEDGTASSTVYLKSGDDINVNYTNDGVIESMRGANQYNECVGKNLSDVFGTGIAREMLSVPNGETRDITDIDGVSVGDSGMKSFYDQMLPSFVRKYTKKWGATVEDVTLPNVEEAGRIMHSVNITPEMKESVMQGQTMFSIGEYNEELEDRNALLDHLYNSGSLTELFARMKDADEFGYGRYYISGYKSMVDFLNDGILDDFSDDEKYGEVRDAVDKYDELEQEWYDEWGARMENIADEYFETFVNNMVLEYSKETPRFSLRDELDPSTMTMREIINHAASRILDDNTANIGRKAAALKTIAKEVRTKIGVANAAAREQRDYDKDTAKQMSDLVKLFVSYGWVDSKHKKDMKDAIGAINDVVGSNTSSRGTNERLEGALEKLFKAAVDSNLKRTKDLFNKLMNIRTEKVDDSRVVKMGAVDALAQQSMQTFRDFVKAKVMMTEEEIDERIATLLQKIDSTNDSVAADRYQAQIDGYNAAKQYATLVAPLLKDEKLIKEEMDDLRDNHEGMTDKQYKEQMDNYKESLYQIKLDQVEALSQVCESLAVFIGQGQVRARQFRDAEKKLLNDVRHDINSDFEGRDAQSQRDSKWLAFAEKADGVLGNGIFKPAQTLNSILKFFGSKYPDGRGKLYNRFFLGWVRCAMDHARAIDDATSTLDKKASEIYGKKMSYADFTDEMNSGRKVTIIYKDNGKDVVRELTQGQAAYIYMVNKMVDGRMKLAAMDICQEEVEAIVGQLDERVIKMCDYIQNEFLPSRRGRYNAVHERMFGAPMAQVEDYFPIRVNDSSRNTESTDHTEDNKANKVGTSTGGVKKRVRNSLPIRLDSDAFKVTMENIMEMEDWASFAEYRKQFNMMLNYPRFKNIVYGMTSPVYGSGHNLYKNLEKAYQLSQGVYDGKGGTMSKIMGNISRGVTASKIAFRLFTAAKQLLSIPAFFPEMASDPTFAWEFIKAMDGYHGVQNYKWCMENLPLFRKRVESKKAGDTRLLDTEDMWSFYDTKMMRGITYAGMWANSAVDAYACAAGAYACYKSKLKYYKSVGMSEEEADMQAKVDAEIIYNETQQSSEGGFVSPIQMNRDFLDRAVSMYNNSSFGYQRRFLECGLGLARQIRYRGAMIDRMAKTYADRYGMEEKAARNLAKKDYRKAMLKNMVGLAVYGYVIQAVWRLSACVPYLILGDDDEEKKRMLRAAVLYGSFSQPIRGTVFGKQAEAVMDEWGRDGFTWSSLLSMIDIPETPYESDLKHLAQLFENDKDAEAISELINMGASVLVGFSPKTFTNMVYAILDSTDGDLEKTSAATMAVIRFMNMPTNNIDQLYIDELGGNAAEIRKSLRDAEKSGDDSIYKKLAKNYIDFYSQSTSYIPRGEEEQEEFDKARGKRLDKKIEERAKTEYYDEYVDLYKQLKESIKEYRSMLGDMTKAEQIDEKWSERGRLYAEIRDPKGDGDKDKKNRLGEILVDRTSDDILAKKNKPEFWDEIGEEDVNKLKDILRRWQQVNSQNQ